MNDTAHLDLLNAEIDGVIDDHGRAELARAVLADPALRAARADLKRLCTTLDSVGELEPPVDLRDSILAALPQSTFRPATPWWSAPAWRQAAVVAGLVAAGAIVFAVVDGRGPATGDLAGTLTRAGSPAIVDSVRLADGPVRGRVSLTRVDAGLGLDLELTAAGPVDVVVTSAGRTLTIPGSGRAPGVAFAVALPGVEAGGQTVDLRFVLAGREVGSATLHAPTGR